MSKVRDLASSPFWADRQVAELLETWGPRDPFHIESGITPSGVIHIGNFREVIVHDIVRRALEDQGFSVVFYYIWDDYDRFRKVPKGMPNPELLKANLGKPVCDVPDPTGEHESYARMNEARFEAELDRVGVPSTYVYQEREYRSGVYADEIRRVLRARRRIRGILDEYRKEPLKDDWWPAIVYSRWTGKDSTRITAYDGAYAVTYECTESGNSETIDFREEPRVKLRWRVDWPMRWSFKDVHYEAAGKDHHSPGSGYETGIRLMHEIWDRDAPTSITYNFVTPKGLGGKISSSKGNVITVSDVLEVYTPEVLRFLFAGSRPNAEFSIPFDDNVLKVYEDFDELERSYYAFEEAESKDQVQTARVYEMSVMNRDDIKETLPLQPSFRQLVMLSQVYGSDEDLLASFDVSSDSDRQRILARARCARNWAHSFAPENWRYARNESVPEGFEASPEERAVFAGLLAALESGRDAEALASTMSALLEEHGIKPRDFFKTAYLLLVNNTKGPRLAPYLIAEKERAVKLLRAIS